MKKLTVVFALAVALIGCDAAAGMPQ